MRRGLMEWSEADLPQTVLSERLSRLQDGLKAAGLGGAVLYTDISRPAAVSFLTGFTPYWSEGLLFVPALGEPVLAVALSKRVAGWIRSVMPAGSIENTPHPAAAIARKLTEAGIRKLGVVELDMFPGAQAETLASGNAVSLEDASAVFRAVRLRVDAAEVVLTRRADALARDCLAAASLKAFDGGDDARRAVAEIEARARLAGAEEVFIGIAPDLGRDSAFLHSDRLDALGQRFAIRLSLSLKGSWIRRTATLSRIPAEQAMLAAANAAFERALSSASTVAALKALEDGFPCKMTAWMVEACVGSYPFEVLARSGRGPAFSGILAVGIVSVQAEINGVPWFGAGPVIREAQP